MRLLKGCTYLHRLIDLRLIEAKNREGSKVDLLGTDRWYEAEWFLRMNPLLYNIAKNGGEAGIVPFGARMDDSLHVDTLRGSLGRDALVLPSRTLSNNGVVS
jgi:hypothetical protein